MKEKRAVAIKKLGEVLLRGSRKGSEAILRLLRFARNNNFRMVCILFWSFVFLFSLQCSASDKPTFAVVNFENKSLLDRLDAYELAIADFVMVYLSQQPGVSQVERAEIDKILLEKGFAETGLMSQKELRTIGSTIGADIVIQGSFEEKQSSGTSIDEAVLALEVQAVDVKSGKVIADSHVTGKFQELCHLIEKGMSNLLRGLGVNPVSIGMEVPAGVPPEAQIYYWRGVGFHRSVCGKHDARLITESLEKAIGEFERALFVWPHYDDARYFMAIILLRLRRHAQSYSEYERLLKDNPKSRYAADCLYLMAFMYVAEHLPMRVRSPAERERAKKKAINLLERRLSDYSDQPSNIGLSLYLLAFAYAEQKMYHKAIETCEELVSLIERTNGDDWYVFFGTSNPPGKWGRSCTKMSTKGIRAMMARYRERLGERAKAYQELKKLYRETSDHKHIEELARMQKRAYDYERAIYNYILVVKKLMIKLDAYRAKKGQMAEWNAHIVEMNMRSTCGWLGGCLRDLGLLPEAIACYQRGHDMSLRIADCYRELGWWKKAFFWYWRSGEVEKLLQRGRPRKVLSREELSRQVSHGSSSKMLWCDLIRCEEECGELPEQPWTKWGPRQGIPFFKHVYSITSFCLDGHTVWAGAFGSVGFDGEGRVVQSGLHIKRDETKAALLKCNERSRRCERFFFLPERGERKIKEIKTDTDNVWVLDEDGKLWRFDKSTCSWSKFWIEKKVPFDYISCFDVAHNSLWLAIEGKKKVAVAQYDITRADWRIYLDEIRKNDELTAIACDVDGIWVGTDSGWIGFFDTATNVWQWNEQIPKHAVERIRLERDRVLFCCGGAGLVVFDRRNGKWETLWHDKRCILPSDKVLDAASDGDFLWVATEGDVYRYYPVSGKKEALSSHFIRISGERVLLGQNLVWFGSSEYPGMVTLTKDKERFEGWSSFFADGEGRKGEIPTFEEVLNNLSEAIENGKFNDYVRKNITGKVNTDQPIDYEDTDSATRHYYIAVRHVKRARKYLKDRNWEAVESEARKALEADPKCGLAYYFLGDVYRAKEMFSEALSAYEKGLKFDYGVHPSPRWRAYLHKTVELIDFMKNQ